MPHAIVLGCTGQVGVAVASELARAGWSVTGVHRGGHTFQAELSALGVEERLHDRDAASLTALGGADALIDVIAFTEAHGRQLLDVSPDVGALVLISSASVYRDVDGRTLDEAAQTGFPRFDGPLDEEHPTVAPGDATYSTRKVLIERLLLEEARAPATVLRPCAIHGPHTSHPRELWFLKRALDGRGRTPLAFNGESRFHTTAAAELARVCRLALQRPEARILNVGDPNPLTVAEIGAAVFAALDVPWSPVLLPGAPVGTVGRTPWSIPRSMIVDTARARALGGPPSPPYAEAVVPTCRWLAETLADRDWREAFPHLALYGYDWFDYAAEKAWLMVNDG